MASKKLNVGDFGDEVVRLHEDLKKGGIDVPTSETKRKFFGPATREAISELQKKYGLNPTGEVDSVTAAVLSGTSTPGTLNAENRQFTASPHDTGASLAA